MCLGLRASDMGFQLSIYVSIYAIETSRNRRAFTQNLSALLTNFTNREYPYRDRLPVAERALQV